MVGAMGLTELYDGWVPIRLSATADAIDVDWCYMSGLPAEDEFFDQTVERCLRRPGRLLFRRHTGADVLRSLATTSPRRPDGLVLHMSRCGSTLVARMLTARGDTLAVSEPAPVDTAVRAVAAGRAGAELVGDVVSAIGGLCGRRRYVVKCDAWTVLDAEVLEAALPGVPWVFVHRDPVEVLMSHVARRGYHMIPGTLTAEALGLEQDEVLRLSPVEYPAVVLGRIVGAAAAALTRGRARVLLVDHADLPAAADRVSSHLGLPDGSTEEMLSVADVHAKNPRLPYVDDRERKQRDAPRELRVAAERWVRPAYEALLTAGRTAA